MRTTGRKKVDFGGENTTAKGKERRSRFFLRLKVQKQKHFVFFGVKVFSRSSSSFEEEVEKKSNGVVWLERIRLIGQRPQRHHREGDAIIKKGFGALGTKR